MTRETHLRALRAAAHIACATTLFACGPKTNGPEASTTATQTAASSAEAAPAPTAPASPDVRSLEPLDSFSEKAQACIDKIDPQLVAEPRLADTPENVECCEVITQSMDAMSGGGFAGREAWNNTGACCDLLQWQGSVACTPWGPPTPPAMRGLA